MRQVWVHSRTLVGNRNFMNLVLSVSILTGAAGAAGGAPRVRSGRGAARAQAHATLNLDLDLDPAGLGYAYLTVVGQLLRPCGYSDSLAGEASAVFAGANAGGCMLYVVLLGSGKRERQYSAHQTAFSTAFASGLGLVLLTAAPGAGERTPPHPTFVCPRPASRPAWRSPCCPSRPPQPPSVGLHRLPSARCSGRSRTEVLLCWALVGVASGPLVGRGTRPCPSAVRPSAPADAPGAFRGQTALWPPLSALLTPPPPRRSGRCPSSTALR